MKSVGISSVNLSSEIYKILFRCAKRKLEERRIKAILNEGDFLLEFEVDNSYSKGRYSIKRRDNHYRLICADGSAVFAALGSFLFASEFDGKGGFIPRESDLDFTPVNPIRGMYFASHFHNFYENAPIEDIYDVIEDLALRGCNNLLLWFDMHQYTSMEDSNATFMINRIKDIFLYAGKMGISTSLLNLANEAFSTSPISLRAENIKQNRYHLKPCDHYGVEICPSKQGGIEEILKERKEMLSYFQDVPVDYLIYWPYDQGGCTCKECQPWGANGFLKILPKYRDLVKEMFPDTKLIISTWYFSKHIDGEWEEFCEALKAGKVGDFAYLMTFFRHGQIPSCIDKEITDKYRFISFPEISMEGCQPWGGFGMSTLLRSLQKTNESCCGLYAGGFPYSEGIYDDINKAVMLGWYSGNYRNSKDALQSYLSFEFCVHGKDLETLTEAVYLLEDNLTKEKKYDIGEEPRYTVADCDKAEKALRILEEFNQKLPEQIKQSKKFRLLYLRAVIDRELSVTDGYCLKSDICQKALKEVNEIYCVDEETEYQVRAPFGENPLKYRIRVMI